MDSNPISRAALGNIASIGDLYDARSDNFCGLSIFKQVIPFEALTSTDADFSDIQLIHSDDFSDKFHKLDVKAELQVSVLAGLFKLEGSGHYLQDQKKSARTVKSSLLYNIKTREENVNLYHEKLRKAFAIDAIECGMATHVVVGTSWGANSVLSCEYQNMEGKDVQQIEGGLSAELNKLSLQIKGKAEVEYKDGEILNSSNFKIRIYGDVLPSKEDLPTDVKGALRLMKQMPSLVFKCNNGKGKPLTYKLVPITLLKNYLNFAMKSDAMLKTIEEASLLRVVKLFEELSKTQQKVHDFHEDALKYRYCVEDGDFKKIASLKEELTIQESKLRSKLATTLVKVRSGEVEASKLEDLIKEFQTGLCSPQKVEATLNTWGDLIRKINFARNVVSNGAKYIGYGVDLDDEILKDFEAKTFVLYFNRGSRTDAQVWIRNRQIFFQELKKGSEGCRAYVVDCDIHPTLFPQGKSSCIQVVQNGQVLSDDLRLEQEQQEGIPLAQATAGTRRIIHKPNKRVPLSIPCPGKNCGDEENHDWICKKCKSELEWGFDQHVYCKCGMTPAILLEFKCPDPRHGIAFEKHDDTEHYEELLRKLTPFKELNILILGETGVGKSTWINAFVNFMKYSSLEEAEALDMVTLIPSKFTVYNENFEEVLVKTGDDKNEIMEDGQSATQQAKIYSFNIGRTTIRLIDTPGVGDVRGVDQDKLNFQNIIDTLSHLEELHGICILLKPNNSRVTVMFRFCIKELLTHLHRDASKNIVFCFTNSRGTFYKPGDTMPVLKKLLQEKQGAGIVLSQHTVYCYDSEAYRFLAAVKNNPPVVFPEDEKENFSQSWNKSIKETMRMLEHIKQLEAHPIKSTINLNHARAMILKLTKPLAEISRNIQTNKNIVKDEKDFIEKGNESIESLKKKLWTTRITIEARKVDHPKTVCSHPSCTQVRSLGENNKTIEYTQICHNPCGLEGVQADTIGDSRLLGCWAMINGVCRHSTCGHSWREHLHVYYDSIPVPKQVMDESIKEALASTTNAQEAKRQIIESKDKLIREYEGELKEIQDASIIFAYFLKTNAITPYNDGMEKYLDHLIREEGEKVAAGGNRKTYDELVKSKESYIEERRILEEAMEKGKKENGGKNAFTPEEIEKKVKHLKRLKHCGQTLREALDCVTRAGEAASHSAIVHVPVPPVSHRKKRGIGGTVAAGFQKIWNMF